MYDKVLTNGVDYYIDGYTNNDKVGTASAKIVGMGKYSGSKSFTYKILPKPYKVTFNENGGQAVSDKDVGYGAAAGTLPTPTRTGYTFAGWYTAASGGSKITSSTQVTEAVTCYAHWTIKNYSVAFNSNGGGSVAGRSVQHGANIGSLSTPTRTGYTFAGWYTSSYGGSRISAYSKVYGAATVHAHWTAKKYALKLNVNGGKKLKASKAKKTVTYAGKYGSLTKPTKKGYKFKGWYTKKSGGSKITSGSTVTILKSTTLYAHWKKK
ncbi:MAG: InlB B-repeat-containing protein [Clostridiales Family XIII bacterium]|nr:InlB B-repeat-containing protein [Clostridiales Family XIII bacterium]